MTYLLDTCIISALRKEIPNHVKKWFADKHTDTFWISVVTIAEILDGIERLASSKRKVELEAWFSEELLTQFEDRILPIDENVAKTWGRLSATLRKNGINIGVQDMYIAATAQVHSLTIITNNLKHFKDVGISVINPWDK